MNSKIVLVALTAVFIFSSCASLRKGSSRFDSSDSIYVKEDQPKVTVKEAPKPEPAPEPAIVVRQEKVTPVEHSRP
ncbi:MAG: hypothetical protein LC643_01560, partial [Bacteroidales bacterium]|nr:hypothetical protein [Bacteroidales bacterium]